MIVPPSSSFLVASDHAGLDLKNNLKDLRKNLNWKDLGCFNSEKTDYPDYADKLCHLFKEDHFGLLICGTGQGVCMRANRYPNIRAALCWNEEIARLSRAHNKANVLCLPGRFITKTQAVKILDTFLNTDFDKTEAYQKRVKKLSAKLQDS